MDISLVVTVLAAITTLDLVCRTSCCLCWEEKLLVSRHCYKTGGSNFMILRSKSYSFTGIQGGCGGLGSSPVSQVEGFRLLLAHMRYGIFGSTLFPSAGAIQLSTAILLCILLVDKSDEQRHNMRLIRAFEFCALGIVVVCLGSSAQAFASHGSYSDQTVSKPARPIQSKSPHAPQKIPRTSVSLLYSLPPHS
jgi:hypothetical protein